MDPANPNAEPVRSTCVIGQTVTSPSDFSTRYDIANLPDLSLPMNKSKATTVMDHTSYVYDSSALDQDFENWFEVSKHAVYMQKNIMFMIKHLN